MRTEATWSSPLISSKDPLHQCWLTHRASALIQTPETSKSPRPLPPPHPCTPARYPARFRPARALEFARPAPPRLTHLSRAARDPTLSTAAQTLDRTTHNPRPSPPPPALRRSCDTTRRSENRAAQSPASDPLQSIPLVNELPPPPPPSRHPCVRSR